MEVIEPSGRSYAPELQESGRFLRGRLQSDGKGARGLTPSQAIGPARTPSRGRYPAVPSFTKNIALQHAYHAMRFPEHPAFANADFIYARNPIVVMRALQCGQHVLHGSLPPVG